MCCFAYCLRWGETVNSSCFPLKNFNILNRSTDVYSTMFYQISKQKHQNYNPEVLYYNFWLVGLFIFSWSRPSVLSLCKKTALTEPFLRSHEHNSVTKNMFSAETSKSHNIANNAWLDKENRDVWWMLTMDIMVSDPPAYSLKYIWQTLVFVLNLYNRVTAHVFCPR